MSAQMHSKFIGLISAAFLAACGGGGSSSTTAPPPPVVNQSVGGAWIGVDSNGNNIAVLATETGRFHLLSDNGQQGFGIASVSNGNTITLNYTLVVALNFTFLDGSTSASCNGNGTVVERQTLTVSVTCTTALGSVETASASLTYDAHYDRDSSLALIAGNYDDFGDVLTIDTNGVLFEQSVFTGCVLNGQVSIIDSLWNAYDVAIDVNNCIGADAVLNGSTFDGLASLESDGVTDFLIIAVTGDVAGVIVSIVVAIPRI